MLEGRPTLEFPSSGIVSARLCEPDGLVCVTAAGPGGHALRVLIDTGTDPAAMDAGLARRLAVMTGGSGIGQGAASDSVAFTEAVLPWLRIGDPASGALVIRNLLAPAVDLSSLPFQVDVVLGYAVIQQLALRIDYRRRTLTLAHPDLGLDALAPHARLVPLAFCDHFPALRDLELGGTRLPIATIDTGSNAALTVGPDVAARHGLLPGAEDVTLALGAGFGGSASILRRSAGPLRIGPLALPEVELDTHLGDAGDLSRSGRANLGNQLLARLGAITLDYERRTLAFEPDEG